METQLTSDEIKEKLQLLQDYNPAQKALAILEKNDGRLDTAFDELWYEKKSPEEMYQYDPNRKSFWKVTLEVLRQELCGDEGFRAQFKEYTKNPGSAPLLTGLIVSMVTISGLPIDPAIATIIVLYILKIGLNIFCEYTAKGSDSNNM
ncbi:MAG: hypothetical protein F6K22_23105 [Okeania sp. SIO2F4]|uniref:hypothetical protein n=1 Tax=Okeania sp. SIO2F4 TaxID=2607790 RepID=UPI00142A3871|nr:hypothetical protein [Okeania sp. SIO2F4]NES05448.1 hypothetical protein [Okeania sp. SIO2F4]